MRRLAVILLTMILSVMILGISVSADDIVYTEGTLNYRISNESVIITYNFGKNTEVTVPAMIAGYPVNTIASGAFMNTTYLKKLNLPDTIMWIEDEAIAEGIRVVYNCNTEYPSLTVPSTINGGTYTGNHTIHTWNSGTVTQQPTCSTSGIRKFTCTYEGCNKTMTEEIATIDHTPETIPAVPATTSETGLTEGSKCSVCGAILVEQQVVPMLQSGDNGQGDQTGEGDAVLDDEDDEGGSGTTDSTHTHTVSTTWSSDDSYHWHVCTDNTCNEVFDKATHEWDDGVLTKEATTSSYGVMTYTCTVCGVTKTENILKINTLKLSPSKKTYKSKALKKSKTAFTVKVTKFKGKVSYICDDAAKAAKIKVKKTSSTSSTVKYKITVPKKCKKGTYKITIKAAGNNSYQAGSKTIKIVVK